MSNMGGNSRTLASLRKKLARTEMRLGEAERENTQLRAHDERLKVQELKIMNKEYLAEVRRLRRLLRASQGSSDETKRGGGNTKGSQANSRGAMVDLLKEENALLRSDNKKMSRVISRLQLGTNNNSGNNNKSNGVFMKKSSSSGTQILEEVIAAQYEELTAMRLELARLREENSVLLSHIGTERAQRRLQRKGTGTHNHETYATSMKNREGEPPGEVLDSCIASDRKNDYSTSYDECEREPVFRGPARQKMSLLESTVKVDF